MAWNGSGTYSRPVTTVSPATGGTTIDVADQNTYTADVAAGVNACLAKNGENAATGDINLGSNQLKAVADGTLATDGVNVGQVQGGSFVYEGTVGGTADAITLTLDPTLTAYAAGQVFRFLADSDNTGDVTIDVDGLGAKTVRTQQIRALQAGDIGTNGIYEVVYDGTRFIIQNPARSPHSVHVNNSTGNPTISDTEFALDGLTVSTYESIGPTAATTDHTWTALDSVPVGVDWIEVSVEIDTILTGTTIIHQASARETGSSSTDVSAQKIAALIFQDAQNAFKRVSNMNRGIKIPVDGTVRFDGFYSNPNSATVSIDLNLTGYGWN